MAKSNRKPQWLIDAVIKDAAKGEMTLKDLSEKHGVSRMSVRSWTKEVGVEVKRGRPSSFPSTPDEVLEKIIPLMGTIGDKAIANMPGTPSASTIRTKRIALGIESYGRVPKRPADAFAFKPNKTERLMQTWKNTPEFRSFISELSMLQ